MTLIGLNTAAVPSENETKVKIYSLAMAYGCLDEVKKVYAKYDFDHKTYYLKDPKARFEMAQAFLKEIGDIHLGLVSWLTNDDDEIYVDGVLAFKIARPSNVISKQRIRRLED
jgi:hypothetical protein